MPSLPVSPRDVVALLPGREAGAAAPAAHVRVWHERHAVEAELAEGHKRSERRARGAPAERSEWAAWRRFRPLLSTITAANDYHRARTATPHAAARNRARPHSTAENCAVGSMRAESKNRGRGSGRRVDEDSQCIREFDAAVDAGADASGPESSPMWRSWPVAHPVIDESASALQRLGYAVGGLGTPPKARSHLSTYRLRGALYAEATAHGAAAFHPG